MTGLKTSSEPFSLVPRPEERSASKPRKSGLTMMMDWGLPLRVQGDWLDLVAPFAGLFMVILFGIVVENAVFRNIELRTVNRWGMQR